MSRGLGKFITRLFQTTKETVGLTQTTSYSEEFTELCKRVDEHEEWQEHIVKKLMGAVETYAGSILDELTDNVIDTSEEELTTFVEEYGLALQKSGQHINSDLGKALLLMSRYVLLISYKEKEYITAVFDQFIDVVKEGESVKTTNEAILHERDILVNKRLDVDAAKGRFNSVDTIDEMQEAEAHLADVNQRFSAQFEIVRDLMSECDRKNTEQIHLLENLAYLHKNFYTACGEISTNMFENLKEFITLTGIRRSRRFGKRPSGLHSSELDHRLAKIMLDEKIMQGLLEDNVDGAVEQVALDNEGNSNNFGKRRFDPIVKPGGEAEVIVVWDYHSDHEEELTVQAGHHLTVKRPANSSPDDVFIDAVNKAGKSGKVPATYLRLAQNELITG